MQEVRRKRRSVGREAEETEATDVRRGSEEGSGRISGEELTKSMAAPFASHRLFSLSKSADAFPTLSLSLSLSLSLTLSLSLSLLPTTVKRQ